MKKAMRLGDLLISEGKLTEQLLQEALQIQKETKKKIGEVLVAEGFVKEIDIIEAFEAQMNIQYVNLEVYDVDPKAIRLISEKLAKKHIVIPIGFEKNQLILAMADPLNIVAIDDVKMITKYDVKPVISTRSSILSVISIYHNKKVAESTTQIFTQTKNAEELEKEVLNEVNNSPIVQLVNSILEQAIEEKASDIHIEPFQEYLRIRYRIDGDLQEMIKLKKSTHSAIITRIKIMGNMDIAEKRVPQDGRSELKIGEREVDLRLSVVPTVFGEKIVLRLLDRSSFLMSKEQLGFTHENIKLFNQIIKSPYGIVFVTGPTGSGKTTTLYSALTDLNTLKKNIITIEDPVEYKLEGINQMQINRKAGLTFSKGLRSILRQDPDIIMIGEIRDNETADIAVRAAITGHLVLSTLHTNDAPSSITRLKDMGVETYLISSAVVAAMAQRLVRRICTACKTSYLSDEALKDKGIEPNTTLYKGTGCNSCNDTGYSGRVAIHEIMTVTEELKEIIDQEGSVNKIRQKAIDNGMKSLKDNCLDLVLKGITTVEELNKIIYNI